jgi:hypothetical protein
MIRPPLFSQLRSIGDDAEIDFGPLSSAGLSGGLSAGAKAYDKQSGLSFGARNIGL